MSDPFQAALEAQFFAPGSSAALYVPVAGPLVPTRAIRSQPDQQVAFGAGQVVLASNEFQLMRSEIANPAEGDAIQLVDDAGLPVPAGHFRITSEPMLDVEGLSWTCGAEIEPV